MENKNSKYIIGNFNETGINCADIDLIKKDWSHLWSISRWHNEYTIIKFLRKNSSIRKFKTKISEEQAKELIEKLKLLELKSGIFKNASTYKREEDYLLSGKNKI
jgi:hypothetical protein